MTTVFSGESANKAVETGNLLLLLTYMLAVQQTLLTDIRTELRVLNELVNNGLNTQTDLGAYRTDPSITN